MVNLKFYEYKIIKKYVRNSILTVLVSFSHSVKIATRFFYNIPRPTIHFPLNKDMCHPTSSQKSGH